MEKVIILGAGAAGFTAAIYTARAQLNPLVVEGIQPGGQLITTTEIENFPGFPEGIHGPELMDRMRQQAARFGARFISASAASVDFGSKPLRLTLDNGDRHEALSVIVATGASSRWLGLESEKKLIGRGVSSCATCDGAFFRNVPVAIVGGGDTAMEEALFLTRFASKVIVIHRRDQFRASRIMASRVLTHPRIEVKWNSTVKEILDVSKNEVTGIRIADVNTGAETVIDVSAVFIAIGHHPNTEIFKGQLDMDEAGYIRTNNTRTSVSDVFAAGDVQDRHYRQAITAAGSGCMAALEVQRYLETLDHE
jgi:thioredoxin reductase (NADPH)